MDGDGRVKIINGTMYIYLDRRVDKTDIKQVHLLPYDGSKTVYIEVPEQEPENEDG